LKIRADNYNNIGDGTFGDYGYFEYIVDLNRYGEIEDIDYDNEY